MFLNYKFRRLALVATLACGAVQAQYVGPNAIPQYNSVRQVLANPIDNARVSLTGFVLRRLDNDDHYLFSDGTHEIRVEIDARFFPNMPISEKTKVTLVGEIEKDTLTRPKIEVDAPLIILTP